MELTELCEEKQIENLFMVMQAERTSILLSRVMGMLYFETFT